MTEGRTQEAGNCTIEINSIQEGLGTVHKPRGPLRGVLVKPRQTAMGEGGGPTNNTWSF